MSINYCLNNVGMLATARLAASVTRMLLAMFDDVKRPFRLRQVSLQMPDLKYFMKHDFTLFATCNCLHFKN